MNRLANKLRSFLRPHRYVVRYRAVDRQVVEYPEADEQPR
jgi:hypothetical protein